MAGRGRPREGVPGCRIHSAARPAGRFEVPTAAARTRPRSGTGCGARHRARPGAWLEGRGSGRRGGAERVGGEGAVGSEEGEKAAAGCVESFNLRRVAHEGCARRRPAYLGRRRPPEPRVKRLPRRRLRRPHLRR